MRTALVVAAVLTTLPRLVAAAPPIDVAPSSRDVAKAIDAFLGPAEAPALAAPAEAVGGFDGGFWLAGGGRRLLANLTLQARYEAFLVRSRDARPRPGGQLSGFSLPRATLRLATESTCDVRGFLALEFGHPGDWFDNSVSATSFAADLASGAVPDLGAPNAAAPVDFGVCREAWVELGTDPAFACRVGYVGTPATRQLMAAPEQQLFVDVALATSFCGTFLPGYSDRPSDYGLLLRGDVLARRNLSYVVTVTNGDSSVRRNVLDGGTDDTLSFGARLDADVVGAVGYDERTRDDAPLAVSVGAWAQAYDQRTERPTLRFADRLAGGVDAAVVWRQLAATAAFNLVRFDRSEVGADLEGRSWLVQVGWRPCGSAFELGVRADGYTLDADAGRFGATEVGVVVARSLGTASRVALDASFVRSLRDGNGQGDVYAGYLPTGRSDATLLRFQWELVL